MANAVAKQKSPLQSISAFMNGANVKAKFTEMLGDKAPQFISSIMSAVSTNPQLVQATPSSIYGAAMMACVVGLPVGNFGAAYIVAYKNKRKDENGNEYWTTEAQYQIGARGYRMLAQDTKMYSSIHFDVVYEGDIASYDVKTGIFTFATLSMDEFLARKSKKKIGYFASFVTKYGEEEHFFMTIKEMQEYAKKYSKNYDKSTSLWKTDFESMALKTILKRLLKAKGIVSYEITQAMKYDQAFLSKNENDTSDINDVEIKYKDNPASITEEEATEVLEEVNEKKNLVAEAMKESVK